MSYLVYWNYIKLSILKWSYFHRLNLPWDSYYTTMVLECWSQYFLKKSSKNWRSKFSRFYRNFWTQNKLTEFFCCCHTAYIFCTCAVLSIIHCWTHFQRTALSMIACIHWHESETFACEFSFNFKFIWGNVSFTNLQNIRHMDSVQYQWQFYGQFYVKF